MKCLSVNNGARLVSRLKEWVSAGYLKLTGGTVKGRLTVEGNVMVPRHRIEGNKVVIGKNPSDGSGGLYGYTVAGELARLLKYSSDGKLEIYPQEPSQPEVERKIVGFECEVEFDYNVTMTEGLNVGGDLNVSGWSILSWVKTHDLVISQSNSEPEHSYNLLFGFGGKTYKTMRYGMAGGNTPILFVGEQAAKEAGANTQIYGGKEIKFQVVNQTDTTMTDTPIRVYGRTADRRYGVELRGDITVYNAEGLDYDLFTLFEDVDALTVDSADLRNLLTEHENRITRLEGQLPRYETCGWTFAEFMDRALTAYNAGGREALETLFADIAYTATCYDKWDPTRAYQTGKYQNDKKLVYAPAVDMSRTVSMGSLYANCTALREIPPVTAHRCTNASYMATGCTSLVKVGRIELAMTGIADNDLWQQTYRMFEGDTALEEYMGGLDHVLSTNAMFKDCTGLRRLDLSGLSNLKLMGLDFNGAKNLRVYGLDELYLDSVTQGNFIASGQYRTNAPLFDDDDPDDPHILNLTTGPGWKAGHLNLLVYGTTVRECNIDIANNHDLSCYGTFGGCTELEKVNFLDFLNTGFEMLDGVFLVGTAKLKFLLIKNIGAVETSGGKTAVSYPFSGASNWGTGSDENRQSLIDTLLTYSKDRVAAGYTVPCTINLSATTKGLLTQEEIAAITAKGYTIA